MLCCLFEEKDLLVFYTILIENPDFKTEAALAAKKG